MAFDSIDSWLIIALVIVVLFYGSTKLPQLAKSIGRSMGEFKKGRAEAERELKEEQAKANATSATTPSTAPSR
jgi:sec-independent protein translocase protein TatA